MWKLSYEFEIRSTYRLDIIHSWYPPLSFIGLCSFYPFFSPWFEITLNSLRLLQPSRCRKCIPIDTWATVLVKRFDKCKKGIISSPVLAKYDSDTHFSLIRIGQLRVWNTSSFNLTTARSSKLQQLKFWRQECVILRWYWKVHVSA